MERMRAGRGGHGNGQRPPHSSRGRLVAAALLVLAAHFLLQPVALSFAGGSWQQLLSRSRPQASLLPRSFFAAPAPLPTEEELEELEKEDEAAAEAAAKILAEAAEKAEEAAQKAKEAAAKPDNVDDLGDFFNIAQDGGVDVSAFKDVPQDQWLKGTVNHVLPFGLLIDVVHPDSGEVVTSLCHISRISQGFVSEEALATYAVGKEVEVRIVEVNLEANKLKLSMASLEPGLREFDWEAYKAMSGDEALVARVTGHAAFGIFVRVEEPFGEGVVFNRALKFSEVPLVEKFPVGQELKVNILKVREQEQKLDFNLDPSEKEEAIEELKVDLEAVKKLPPGTVLPATIYKITSIGLFVQVEEPQATGLVHMSKLPRTPLTLAEAYKVGQELQVCVEAIKDNGQLGFSLSTKGSAVAALSRLPADTVLKGTVTRVETYGVMVEAQIADGPSVTGLLHKSEMPTFYDPNHYSEGQELEVLVLRADAEQNLISFRPAAPEALAQLPMTELATIRKLPPGTMLDAAVYRIMDFGLFVKVEKPPATGLIHVSTLPRTPLSLQEAYKIGQEVKVYILEVKDNGQINFGMKADDSFGLFAKLTPETVLKGKVTKVIKHGVILDVAMTPDGPWGQGMVHVSRLPKQGPPGGYAPGQELEVVVLGVSDEPGRQRLELGMPNGKEQPESQAKADERPILNDVEGLQKLPPGTLMPATIQKILVTGLQVEVQKPLARGLLHIRHMPQTRRSLDEVYEVGQEIEVYLKAVWDGKVDFAMQVENPLEEFGKLSSDTVLKGTVRRVLEFGLIVEAEMTPDGPFATGLLHKSRMPKAPEDYSVGEELEVAVEKVEIEDGQMAFQLPTKNVEVERKAKQPMRYDFEGLRKLPPRAPLTATVQKIVGKGLIVQVDKPFATGLLHTRQLPQIRRPLEEVYNLGQELQVYVETVREEIGQVDFGMEVESPLEQFQGLQHTQMLKAKVKNVLKFGLIVEAEMTPDGPWAVGLLHKSRMEAFAEEDHYVGQELQVGVFSVDLENSKIAFTQTAKKVQNTPEIIQAFAEAPQTPLKGIVKSVMSFGLMLEVDLTPDGPTGTGLLHRSEFNGVFKPDDYSDGQEMTVSVLSTNEDKVEISFTQPVGLTARVVAAHQIGVFVEVESGGETIEGVVESSTFTSEALKEDPAAFLARGQEVLVSELPGGDRGKFFVFADEKSIVGEEIGDDAADEKGIVGEEIGDDVPVAEAQLDLDDDSGESSEGSDSVPPAINRIFSQYEGPLSDNGYDDLDLLRQLNDNEWAEMAQVIGMEPSQAAELRAALN